MMGLFGGEMGPLGWVATGAFWVLLLGLAVWLIARLLPGSAKPTTAAGDSPMEILNSRLAGGEIDLADWQAQRATLERPVAKTTDRSRESR
jgi:putative membrane protein